MNLHQIQKPKERKIKRRIGRGGKRGTYCGRGVKGQKSRAGSSPRPQWRDFLKTLPKKRGYRFSPVSEKPVPINLKALSQTFQNGVVVDQKKLVEAGLITTGNRKNRKLQVKILGDGKLTKKLTISGLLVSKTAAEKIKKAGGKII